jgi:hypothetical protein
MGGNRGANQEMRRFVLGWLRHYPWAQGNLSAGEPLAQLYLILQPMVYQLSLNPVSTCYLNIF